MAGKFDDNAARAAVLELANAVEALAAESPVSIDLKRRVRATIAETRRLAERTDLKQARADKQS